MLRAVRNSKYSFYFNLWRLYLTNSRGLPDTPVVDSSLLSWSQACFLNGKRIHFWVPHNTAGAQFILWEVIPALIQRLGDLEVNVDLSISETIPAIPFDLILSFKEPLPKTVLADRKVLVICDEVDRLWPYLESFDAAVCTSSLELGELIKTRVDNIYFVPEIEPEVLLEVGKDRLIKGVNELSNSLFWHGGKYTLKELIDLKSFFLRLRERIRFESLEIVCGDGVLPPELVKEPWINMHSWSRDNLVGASKKCRLAVLPARLSLKNAYLKPASRIRCSYALGVPALGDARVPEVERLSHRLGIPVLDFADEDGALNAIADLWNSPTALGEAAESGYHFVKTKHSLEAALSSWNGVLSNLLDDT